MTQKAKRILLTAQSLSPGPSPKGNYILDSPAPFVYSSSTMKNKGKFPTTLQQAIIYFSDAENCSNFLSQLRWPNGVECPNCLAREVSYLSTRRLWKCKACKK